MTTTADLKRGMRIELDGDPYQVVDLGSQSPSARAAATLVKTRLRNLRTKQLVSHTFKAGERIKLPNFEIHPCQYLYNEGGEVFYFMDEESYEQHPVQREMIEYELGFLLENAVVRAVFFEGQCIGIELPPTVELEVTECEPSNKGDTATHTTKAATLQTGLELQVPTFVDRGDRLVIDTREARYVRRA
jgi:elongation factor P